MVFELFIHRHNWKKKLFTQIFLMCDLVFIVFFCEKMYIYLFNCQWQSDTSALNEFVLNIPITWHEINQTSPAKFWKLKSITSILYLNLKIIMTMILLQRQNFSLLLIPLSPGQQTWLLRLIVDDKLWSRGFLRAQQETALFHPVRGRQGLFPFNFFIFFHKTWEKNWLASFTVKGLVSLSVRNPGSASV